jgi:pimeloyl-ACP methyl ester carboxylesterase
LIHGLGATPAYFQPLAVRLARYGMVYAPHLPGLDGTMRLPGAQSTAAVADALAMVGVQIGAGPYVIIGHSLGCQIATCLVARHPDLAAGLVLLAPAPDPSAGPLLCQALALARDIPSEPYALLKLMTPALLRAGPRYFLTAIRAMRRYHWTANLRRITTPTLVVRGTCDPLVSHRWGEKVAHLLPNARMIEVPDAPHGVNFTDPALLTDATLDLARSV